MTTPIESSRRAGARSAFGMRRREWWRSALTAGWVIAGAVGAILLGAGTSGEWAEVLASLLGFATAITLIAAAVVNWEHIVGDAQSAGLIVDRGER